MLIEAENDGKCCKYFFSDAVSLIEVKQLSRISLKTYNLLPLAGVTTHYTLFSKDVTEIFHIT